MVTAHKYSVKRLKRETEELVKKVGANVQVAENENGTVTFTNAWGKKWQSNPMTVEEAKFYLFGYRQAKGVGNEEEQRAQRGNTSQSVRRPNRYSDARR